MELINQKKSPIQDDYIEKYLAEKDLNLTATLDYSWGFCPPNILHIVNHKKRRIAIYRKISLDFENILPKNKKIEMDFVIIVLYH